MINNIKADKISFGLILLLSMFTAMDALAIDIYLPAFPILSKDLGVSSGEIQQTLSIFLIGLALGQGIYGPLLDHYGRKLPLLIGTIVFIIGSVIAALAPDLGWLLSARFLQALGASAGLVTPRVIISDICNEKTSAKNFSILMQIMMIVPIIAPILGSHLLQIGSWRIIFYALTGLGILIFIFGIFVIKETLNPALKQPLELNTIVNNYKELLRNYPYLKYTIISGFLFGSFFLYISNAPYIFIEYYNINELYFSYIFAINAVGFIIIGQFSVFLMKKFSTEYILSIGGIVFTVASLLLVLSVFLFKINVWQYAILLGLTIGSTGLIFGSLISIIMQKVNPKISGSASSLLGLIKYMMSALIGFVAGAIGENIIILPIALFISGALLLMLHWHKFKIEVYE